MSGSLPANSTSPVITPTIVTADNFLSDTIIFALQNRFSEQSIVRTFTIPNAVERDFANFAMIALSETTPAYYSVSMTAPTYSRIAVQKVIDRDITELLNA